jgi:hypothetical protein
MGKDVVFVIKDSKNLSRLVRWKTDVFELFEQDLKAILNILSHISSGQNGK